MKYDAIIVASGKGERAKLGYNKVLYKLKNGRTVLEESSHLFIEDNDCLNIIIVTDEDIKINNNKIKYTKGGPLRSDSVYNGLSLVSSEYVLIHDGARPFLNKEDLENIKKEIEINNAALLVKKCIDTVKYSKDSFVEKTIDRNDIYLALTPQGAKTTLLKKAYEKVRKNNINITDDASVLEYDDVKVKIVIGNSSNIKLTNKEDFINL